MDIEKRMESVVEIWNKNGEVLPLLLKTPYQELDTAGEDLNQYQEVCVENIFHQMCYQSIDVALETMNAKVKKGILKMDWDADERFSFIGQYLRDFYNSEEEKEF
jgi:hypothetical protein